MLPRKLSLHVKWFFASFPFGKTDLWYELAPRCATSARFPCVCAQNGSAQKNLFLPHHHFPPFPFFALKICTAAGFLWGRCQAQNVFCNIIRSLLGENIHYFKILRANLALIFEHFYGPLIAKYGEMKSVGCIFFHPRRQGQQHLNAVRTQQQLLLFLSRTFFLSLCAGK